MYLQAYQQYKTMEAQTADRGELVVMLYQGILRFLGRASHSLKGGSLEEAHESLVRAQDILVELMGSLNMDSGEIATNLFRLYEYMHHRLVQANVAKDPEAVEEVANFAREMLPAWQLAAKRARVDAQVTGTVA